MYKLLHFYNQNRKKIWSIILFISFILLLIRLLNYLAATPKENNTVSKNNSQIQQIEEKNTIVPSTKSLVEGEEISSSKLNSDRNLIESFINYCNNGEVQKAYDILTDECKEELYPTIEIFRDNYFIRLFNNAKKCIMENWISSTYKVTIMEDMITTGKNINQGNYSEYMTIVRNEGTYKLNINNYIGRTEINKVTDQKGIEFNVVNKDTYLDYEKYNIEITNKSNNNILLDKLENIDTIYLQDSNNVKYKLYGSNLLNNEMIINKGLKKNLKISFSNGYTSNRKLKYLVFSELVFDYQGDNNINNQETQTFYIDL